MGTIRTIFSSKRKILYGAGAGSSRVDFYSILFLVFFFPLSDIGFPFHHYSCFLLFFIYSRPTFHFVSSIKCVCGHSLTFLFKASSDRLIDVWYVYVTANEFILNCSNLGYLFRVPHTFPSKYFPILYSLVSKISFHFFFKLLIKWCHQR